MFNTLSCLLLSTPVDPKSILLSPCPLHELFTSLNLLFLISLVASALNKLIRKNSVSDLERKRLLTPPEARITTSLRFNLVFAISLLLAAAYLTLSILSIFGRQPRYYRIADLSFLVTLFIANFSAAILIASEKKFLDSVHPLPLRGYWIFSFFLSSLFAAFSVRRFTGEGPTLPDDLITLVAFPLYVFVFYVAVTGSTGIYLYRPETGPDRSNVTPYANASIFSRATWSWLNPLLIKGYKSALELDDIPNLAPVHQAERLVQLFESNWPETVEKLDRPVLTALLRCFWPELVLTGVLAIVKLMVMYVGPTLVSGFMKYASGERSASVTEVWKLCGMLMAAKFLEVLASHQYNFVSGNMGMMVRSTLITALYHKGLKLSCSSRQKHGIGMIVNYMAVDAQQLADMTMQMHDLWLMPVQVVVALGLLYLHLGVMVAATTTGIMFIMVMVVVLTKKSNVYQFLLKGMRDKRMKAVNEMLSHMRVIKFQAWEQHFNGCIDQFRFGEFMWLSRFLYTFSASMTALGSSSTVLSILTFVVSSLAGHPLTAATVFTATSFFRLLGDPLGTFPPAMISMSQAIISLKRLDDYLTSGELDESAMERIEVSGRDGVAIEVRDGVFAWRDDDGVAPTLKGLDFQIRCGMLVAVVGMMGSGKSSLVSCLIGEMRKIGGKVRVCGTTAYVAQTAWIQNGTIQENILFGESMVPEKYKEVIRVCCLEKDLNMMEFGDQTEIGENGINLSGGQRQRIQLARAVYQDCDIYLLDDVFSAVDAHTGSELFKECVRGVLKVKTVVLVTHQVDFLRNADLILVMRDGEIVQSGKYDELLSLGSDFEALVAAHDGLMELVTHGGADQRSRTSDQSIMKRELSNKEKVSVILPKADKHAKLIEEEKRETGCVGWNVYRSYMTEAWGWWGVFVVCLVSVLAQGSSMASDYWLAYETSEKNVESFRSSLFIEVYSIIALVSIVFGAVKMFLVTYLGLVTAQIFFKQILNSILHAPMSFFDMTPSGRILSRASSDQTNIDLFLAFRMGMIITDYFTVIGVVFVICQVAWPTVIFIIPLGWLNIWYRGYYLATSRELTRLESITKAPVIQHFSETILGVTTIRCFGKVERFSQENLSRVNSSLRMDFHNKALSEWFGFRIELIGSFILCISAILMVTLPRGFVKPEYVGLSLSYGLSLSSALFWAVWITCVVENRMVSVERIKQFTNIPSEAAWEIKDCLPSSGWPSQGNIDIYDLQVRYGKNTPLVLNGMTLSIKGGEKIAVVGRTGSGKSTFIQAFFRIVEPSGGKIIVDGVDICTLGLHDLRSHFSIIPQEPVLFEGTVRSNIDPTGQYSDDEIWQSLERCQLKAVVAAKPEKLDASVVDYGENWSVGQRQLLCLGRVMLKHSKILFMDEATASVDSQTDGAIQKIIREGFASCTIISVAHRIPMVMDCDRVLVIDAGRAKEFDSPSNLIEWPSLFGALVQEYANRSSDL